MFFIQLDHLRRLTFLLDQSSELKTLLTNSSRNITCVIFLNFRRNTNQRRRSQRRTRGTEHTHRQLPADRIKVLPELSTQRSLQQKEPKFLKKPRSPQKKHIHITTTNIIHDNPNCTHKMFAHSSVFASQISSGSWFQILAALMLKAAFWGFLRTKLLNLFLQKVYKLILRFLIYCWILEFCASIY